MKTLAALKELITVLTMLVALCQMLFTNDRRAKEHLENLDNIAKLTRQVDRQNEYIEAALNAE